MVIRWLVVVLLAAALVWGVTARRELLVSYMILTAPGAPPPLAAPADEGPDARWADDYFTVERIAPRTFALGEPRYAQQNYSYLLIGSERALLFDAGPGVRDIRRLAEGLTDLPITFLPSHFHYDHVGNTVTFDRIAVVDLPYLRARADGNRLTLTRTEHLGAAEGFAAPTWTVDEWLTPGAAVALGDRTLLLLHAPGHTTDSVALYDAAIGAVFSGDYLYPGDLYGFLPNSSMGDYLATAKRLLAAVPEGTVFFGAHRVRPPGAPQLGFTDLEDLHRGLEAMRAGTLAGTGGWVQSFPINDRLAMLAEPRWLQRWD